MPSAAGLSRVHSATIFRAQVSAANVEPGEKAATVRPVARALLARVLALSSPRSTAQNRATRALRQL
jgi:hypothetical protein